MSVLIQPRCESGGVAAHLQCPLCGYCSKSHAHQLSHVAAVHPERLDSVAFGRLGNILMYQSTAQLFHCFDCFFTSKDFTKVYKHVITKHCMDEREAATEEAGEKGDEKTGEEVKEEEREGGEGSKKRKSSNEEEDSAKRLQEQQEGEESVKTEKSSEGRENVEAEGHHGDGGTAQTDGEREESVLIFDGVSFCCMMCSWKSKLKGVAVNHVVRRHSVPRAYATQAIQEDEAAGLNSELLRVEMEATDRVIRFASNRFVCQICGWKTKLKGKGVDGGLSLSGGLTEAVCVLAGLAITHVERSHEVERPYGCRDCQLTFFLPSRLQQHVTSAHRPGRYVCPFCCFRSHFLGGFKRHCSRCNAREGEEARLGGGGEEKEHKEEEGEKRTGRTRRKTAKMIKEEELDDGDY